MLHDAADKVHSFLGYFLRIVRIGKYILPIHIMKRKIKMHAGSVNARSRLWHKSRMQTVLARNGPDSQAECLDIVRCFQSFIIMKIHFVLGGSALVVARLDLEPHVLQCEHYIASRILTEINRTQIKIPCHLARIRRRIPLVVRLEQEELAFSPDIEKISIPCRILDRLLQNVS